VQRLLKPDEALVAFTTLPAVGKLPEIGFVWAITKTEARWEQTKYGRPSTQALVSILRCGLDSTNWTDATRWSEGTDEEKRLKAEQVNRRQSCSMALQRDVPDDRPAPFALVAAHELYSSLFGRIEEVIKGKQLLLVPTDALTSLPFQALVTQPPAVAIADKDADYAGVAWFGQRHALTVLPSVSSLAALRGTARPTRAQEPFAGFGNPLLVGSAGMDRSAFARQDCNTLPKDKLAVMVASRAPTLSRDQIADVEILRRQAPLPETADELCSVAASLSAPPTAVHLGESATETTVKDLSSGGALARARVVHFATHGLLATETQMAAAALSEPALILTPPRNATAEDDGLLTASEVAQLQLDADWVVLSACNTAAAENNGAEDLSGLARAFFYAGARALLVSHWYVDSNVTVALITRTFAALKADPRMGRAEALRRAMSGLMAEDRFAHPARWAPFVVVGEGGALAR
jgi:CHAT domain-containing protein